jgi:hypothetical protein
MIGITPTSIATRRAMRDLVTTSTTLTATIGLDKKAVVQASGHRAWLSTGCGDRHFAEQFPL